MSLGTPRPSAARATILIGLLFATILLASLLAYEAHDAARSQRVTAERVLRDYASLAAWEFVSATRKSLDELVVRALGPVTSGLASSPYETLLPPAAIQPSADQVLRCEHDSPDSSRVYFRLDLRTDALTTSGAILPAAELAWLTDTVAAYSRLVAQPESPYRAMLVKRQGIDRAIAVGVRYARRGAPLSAFGVIACGSAFGAPLFDRVMRSHALLPGSVSGGASNDSVLALRVVRADGSELYHSIPSDGSTFTGTAMLDAGAGLTVEATLLRAAADRLLVEPPQRSRLPLLFGTLALTAGLAIVALLQLRREHELARLRADFTSSVSHELRTPLAQILLFGETLSLGRIRSEGERKLAADTIVQEARRLMHMVENVLHFERARGERPEMAVEATPLAPLLEAIATGFAPLAEASGARIALDVAGAPVAMAQAGAVRQIVLNLLDNAMKYGPAGQTITLCGLTADGRARVEVKDEGPGIEAPDRERIWGPYVRLRRDQNLARGGSGIGLSVVRELSESLGGRAWVEAGAPGGARFVVELPLAPDAHLARTRAERQTMGRA